MRVLLVSHPPLTAEYGAAQTALNLQEALRARGHQARAWSPEPLPAGTPWYRVWQAQRLALLRHVHESGPFDLVDTPAISAAPSLGDSSATLVRSIQPELAYLRISVGPSTLRRPTPRRVAHALAGVSQAAAIVAGWRRADGIVCLGTTELERMATRFPRWRHKLGAYRCAPAAAERTALLAVRSARPALPRAVGVRFLWIGRWAEHKGTAVLKRFLVARARSHFQDSFTVAGCGDGASRELPADLQRDGRLQVVPAFSRSELPGLLASHDAGLFTSVVEGWGQSLNEMLESGMPVYATPAGGVADLRPYFPNTLRGFPPPTGNPPPVVLEDLVATGYADAFTWAAIARDYESQASAALERWTRRMMRRR